MLIWNSMNTSLYIHFFFNSELIFQPFKIKSNPVIQLRHFKDFDSIFFSWVLVKQKHLLQYTHIAGTFLLPNFTSWIKRKQEVIRWVLTLGPLGRVAVHGADRPLISPVSKLVITNKKPGVRALVAQKSVSSFTPWFLLRLQSINIPHS